MSMDRAHADLNKSNIPGEEHSSRSVELSKFVDIENHCNTSGQDVGMHILISTSSSELVFVIPLTAIVPIHSA